MVTKTSLEVNYAHYKCSQFLIPIYGSMKIDLEDKKSKITKIIDYKKKTRSFN